MGKYLHTFDGCLGDVFLLTDAYCSVFRWLRCLIPSRGFDGALFLKSLIRSPFYMPLM